MTLRFLSESFDRHLGHFCGVPVSLPSIDFMATLSPEFMQEHCPDVMSLPASLVAVENPQETFVTIHVSDGILDVIRRSPSVPELLASVDGLAAALVIAEEISHFHHFVLCANQRKSISKIQLETIAEIQKVAICALMVGDIFGDNHIQLIIQRNFNAATFHGTMTDYRRASKTAEFFWKKSLLRYGSDLLTNRLFRDDLKTVCQSVESSNSAISTIINAA